MIYKVYKLIDPITSRVRYVGVTTQKLNDRLSQHIYDGKHKNYSHKINWIKSLLSKHVKPYIELIEECDEYNWRHREKFWISNYEGLTNSTIGGEGVVLNKSKSSISRSTDAHKIPIVQLDIHGNYIRDYESLTEASNLLKIPNSNISGVINGNFKTTRGFHFVKKENYCVEYKFDARKSFIRNTGKVYVVYKTGEIKIFNNRMILANYLNISYRSIHSIIKESFKSKTRRKFKHIVDIHM